ncbi:NUDIX domain-containing protein [Aestuariibius sp. HNIBRBA575]|uniref:NUDIX domain-containing protein n=1 Tax=Aestuariibius sp. HNIBRBA575 TaxID=3233343 RepID=UPI0034A57204
MRFDGCKVALFIGDDLLIYQRDQKHRLRWAGAWDFPGGGREGRETPEETLAREVQEEFGLDMRDAQILWRIVSRAEHNPLVKVHFFVAQMPAHQEDNIEFGDEGQRWAIRPARDVLEMDNIVPSLPKRTRLFFEKSGLGPHIRFSESEMKETEALIGCPAPTQEEDRFLEQWRYDLIRVYIRDIGILAGEDGFEPAGLSRKISKRLPKLHQPHKDWILEWLDDVVDNMCVQGELDEQEGVVPRRLVLNS